MLASILLYDLWYYHSSVTNYKAVTRNLFAGVFFLRPFPFSFLISFSIPLKSAFTGSGSPWQSAVFEYTFYVFNQSRGNASIGYKCHRISVEQILKTEANVVVLEYITYGYFLCYHLKNIICGVLTLKTPSSYSLESLLSWCTVL